jgi:broad specificity phosphatase PhoE
MKIIWIRHAESIGNQNLQMQGQLDFALSTQGEQQANLLADYLVRTSWPPSHIYSSPLQRAAETTQILLQAWATETNHCNSPVGRLCQRPPSYRAELQEIHNGILQGLTWAEAKRQYPQLCDKLESTPEWVAIPEAESLQEVSDRAHQFVRYLLEAHQNSDRIWVVTHGGLPPYLLAALMGSDRAWGLQIPPTALFEFELDRDRWLLPPPNTHNTTLWKIVRFNETPHLRAEG